MKTLALIIATLLLAPFAGVSSASAANKPERSTLCVSDTVNGGRMCGLVLLHGATSGQQREAWADSTRSRLRSNHVRLHSSYLGWSPKNLSDGVHVYSVKSRKYENRYHLYLARTR